MGAVDVILRRIPDEDADPLELKPTSSLGVPGLVHAARCGQVAVANALGSGFLEAPAVMAFLPAICRHFFDQDLQLPSVATWWCGRADDWRYVESHFDELVLRPAVLHRSAPPILVRQLGRVDRQELLERVRQRPGLWVAQAEVARSTAPVWAGDRLQPWPVGLRVFAAAHRGGYRVMTGGLSRVSSSRDALGESMSAGQRSKDVWVLSERPVEPVSLLGPPAKAVELRRSGNDLPSRVADNLFWVGRHVERAESMVRHLRSAVVRLTNDLQPADLAELEALVAALSDSGELAAQGGPPTAAATFQRLRRDVTSFLFDADRPVGLRPTLQALRATAGTVRDRLSIDSWRIVNQLDLDLFFPRGREGSRLGDVLLLLNHMLSLLSAFSGLATESMTRGAGWRFLDMGRRIERAGQILRLARNMFVTLRADMIPTLEAVLEVADSSMTYRYRYLTSLQLAPVLDLLLVDETNPRAVGFQLSALAEHLRALAAERGDSLQSPEQKILLGAQATLRLADVEGLCEPEQDHVRRHLEQFLDRLTAFLPQLSDSLTYTYLTHTVTTRQLAAFTEMPA